MLLDCLLRREKMADFKAHLERQGKRLEVDMSVQVGPAARALLAQAACLQDSSQAS